MRFYSAGQAAKRRRRIALPLLAVLATSAAAPAVWPSEAAAAAPISIYLDGQKLTTDAPPYVVSNVTMVPLRVVSEGIGASVNWNSKEQKAEIAMSGDSITLKVGQTYAVVNGAQVKLNASVQMKQGRTMVPIRFVSEQLGLTVNWNAASSTVLLSTPGGVKSGGGSGEGPSAGSGEAVPPDTITPPDSGEQPDPITDPGSGAGTDPGSGTITPVSDTQAELRGAWVSTVYNLDWPSTASYKDSSKQKREYTQLLDELQRLGMNAVFVQVRPSGDALYPSSLVPWSAYLTGKQGQAPDYDPLAFMIEETHKRGMQFHAWFNPFRAATTTDKTKLDKNSMVVQHPEWIVNSGGKLYVNPGIPAARQAVIDAVKEVVSRYDVDGVHLDDYFYPSDSPFDDDGTYKLYSAGSLTSKGDWRRANINTFVRQLDENVHALKPSVRFGISPFGVWRNKSTDPAGSDTKAGVTTYDNMYADVRLWIQQGWLDYVAPQIYWSFAQPVVPYDKVADWWLKTVKGTGVDLYIGHAPYKLGTSEAGWQSASEIIRQLDYDKGTGGISGELFFSAKDLRRNPVGIADALRSYYASSR